jgi:glutathione synthase/RimK-type ligase-like ATP-grasp enzyme
MRRIAFLTMDNIEGFVAYDHLAFEPLARRGWHVDEISWRCRGVPWDDYELVVIRTPWDYQQDPTGFLAVLQEIDQSRARLQNDLQTVHWNIRKTYLRDLRDRGISIVPTRWIDCLSVESLAELFAEFDVPRMVVKPVVGANADDTFLLEAPESRYSSHALALTTFADRELMVQPFIESVVNPGEYSLFFFGGEYSHSVLKTPKLRDFRVQEEHGGVICSIQPDQDLVVAATRVMSVLDSVPLYGRVDLVRLPDGNPALMELELIEPSLYFAYDPLAPDRFADAVVRLMR